MDHKTKKVVFAVILILLAVWMILPKFGISVLGFMFGTVSFWDIVWSIICFIVLYDGLTKKSFFLTIMSIAVFGCIHAERFHIDSIAPWPLLGAAFLISVALGILFPNFKRNRSFRHIEYDENGQKRIGKIMRDDNGASYVEYEDGTKAPVGSETDTSIETNFGSTVKYFNQTDFREAQIECNFGAVKAYFMDCVMQGPVANIYVEQNFGETELFIPKEWGTEIHKEKAFASISERGESNSDGAHVVVITAEANFGNIVIHHV